MFINKPSGAARPVSTVLFMLNGESMLMKHMQSKRGQFCGPLTLSGIKHGRACREQIQRGTSTHGGINMWIIFPVLSSIRVKKLRDVEFNMRPGSALQVAPERRKHKGAKRGGGVRIYIYTCVCVCSAVEQNVMAV